MIRVSVIVEGQTEESFVSGPLAESLWPSNVLAKPIILGVPGHKGGRANYARVSKDIIRQLKQDQGSYCTTMIDYYGLGAGFPGTPVPAHLDSLGKVTLIESALHDQICRQVPDLRPDIRFLPYLSLHEFEALLFTDPEALARCLGQPQALGRLRQVRESFATPEDINDGTATAPSKRIIGVCRGYRKVIDGTLAAQTIGIEAILQQCPHFRAWIDRLKALPDLAGSN